jgi:glutamate-1-semialdehyde aminotransferase
MFSGKYHGHADEMLVTERAGRVEPEYYGLPPSVAEHVVLIGFNDAASLERSLAAGDVACLLTEPALTNVGVIHPEPGFHRDLRRLTREAGTLLVLDETHTLVCGPGGLVGRWSLEPDIVTLGKSIGGGVAIGAYGMTTSVATALEDDRGDYGGGDFVPEVATGGTLFGNALQMAASRAALGEVLTPEAYARTSALGQRLADGIDQLAAAAALPWRAQRLFARSGYAFDGAFAVDASGAHRSHDAELYRLLRLFMANRGVWEAIEWAGPTVSVAAVAEDVEAYLGVLSDLVEELTA